MIFQYNYLPHLFSVANPHLRDGLVVKSYHSNKGDTYPDEMVYIESPPEVEGMKR